MSIHDFNNVPHIWLPVEDVVPGMVLAKPVMVSSCGMLVLKIGAGSELTTDNLSQIMRRGVDCVAVYDEARDSQEFEAANAMYLYRLNQIFGCETPDSLSEDCREFYDVLVNVGPRR